MKERSVTPSLAAPPDDASQLAHFPAQTLEPERSLFRVTRQGQGPWWFGNSMAGRFDLREPHGTCYLAADPLAALLEVIGPDRQGGAVLESFLAERRLRRLHVPHPHRLSDLTSRRGTAFGITAEISTIVPYTLPQAWAAALHAAGFEGLVSWLRHDPSRQPGYALFGPRGERQDWKRGRARRIGPALLKQLQDECGVEVMAIPRSDQLRLVRGT